MISYSRGLWVNNNKIAIFILARKNSRRIPFKNTTKLLAGKPLLEWTLDEVEYLPYPKYVFTDCLETADRLKKYDGIYTRPKLYESEDGKHQTNKELIEYNKEIGADIIVLLQVTSPIKKAFLLQSWISTFAIANQDVGFSVYPFKKFVYNKHCNNINAFQFERDYNGGARIDQYVETGSFYIFTKEQLEKNHITTSDKRLIFIDDYNVDLDTQKDWDREEILIKGGFYQN